MRTVQQIRLENKLKLWETPGFDQFLEDLIAIKGTECDIRTEILALKLLYKEELKKIAPKSKYIQLKIKGL